MYVHNEDLARSHLAHLKGLVEKERAVTVDRCERLRRFVRGTTLDRREREEWSAFRQRTAMLEREIGVVTRALVNLESLRAPAAIVLVQPRT
jgi:hypothetical protein